MLYDILRYDLRKHLPQNHHIQLLITAGCIFSITDKAEYVLSVKMANYIHHILSSDIFLTNNGQSQQLPDLQILNLQLPHVFYLLDAIRLIIVPHLPWDMQNQVSHFHRHFDSLIIENRQTIPVQRYYVRFLL